MFFAPVAPVKRDFSTLLLLTMIAIVLFGQGESSPLSFVAFLFALALHEGGHLLAMRLFRYRDLSVFFVPMFGGAAVGTKEDATPGQRVLVSLAGPLPGVALGVALTIYAARTQQVERGHPLIVFAQNLLVLNLFNLLPFPIFDGGQVASLLLFRRHRVLEIGFRAFAGALLVLVAISLKLWFLAVIAVIGLASLPKTWRERAAADRVRAAHSPVAPSANLLLERVVRALFDEASTLTPRADDVERTAAARVVAMRTLHRLASERSPSVAISLLTVLVVSALFFVGLLAAAALFAASAPTPAS